MRGKVETRSTSKYVRKYYEPNEVTIKIPFLVSSCKRNSVCTYQVDGREGKRGLFVVELVLPFPGRSRIWAPHDSAASSLGMYGAQY